MPPPPLPVVDLVAFGALIAILFGLHVAHLRLRDEGQPSGMLDLGQRERTTDRREPTLAFLSQLYHAGAWLSTWYGLALVGRIVGFF